MTEKWARKIENEMIDCTKIKIKKLTGKQTSMQNNKKKARLVRYSSGATVYLSFTTSHYVVFSFIDLCEMYTSYWFWIEVFHDFF